MKFAILTECVGYEGYFFFVVEMSVKPENGVEIYVALALIFVYAAIHIYRFHFRTAIAALGKQGFVAGNFAFKGDYSVQIDGRAVADGKQGKIDFAAYFHYARLYVAIEHESFCGRDEYVLRHAVEVVVHFAFAREAYRGIQPAAFRTADCAVYRA